MIEKFLIKSIFIYPVKSLGGISVEKAYAEERGLQYDRRWMLVDQEGQFLTQRNLPGMALIKGQIIPDGFEYSSPKQKSPIVIPYTPRSNEKLKVKIWEDELFANVMGDHYDIWFSGALDTECRLVHMDDSVERKVNPKYMANNERVSFSDGFPYLIISQSSFDELNKRLLNPVNINRFRPNFLFTGGPSFIEDSFGNFKINQAEFKAVKPCARCIVITIDQETGIKNNDPLTVLSGFRQKDNKVLFGQNVLCLKPGIVAINDELVLQKSLPVGNENKI